jgi:hypothetical protein
MPTEQRDQIEDLALSVERELSAAEPDPSRVRRLLLNTAKVARDVGVSVVAQTITAFARAYGWLPD